MRWLPAVVWAGAIFAVSSMAGSTLPGGFAWEGHLTEYAVLAAFALLATRGDSLVERALIAVSLASAYGVTDELHQAFVTLRTPDPADWAVDTAGAVLAVLLVTWALRSRNRRSQ